MTQDEEEFFETIGCRSERCEEQILITIHNKETGECLADELPIRCGLLVNDNGPAETQCIGCDKYMILCDCGNGVRMDGLIQNDRLICLNDDFCRRNKITEYQL